jgi:hypothetical protein
MLIRQPLTQAEIRQVRAQTGHAGPMIVPIVAAMALLAILGLVFATSPFDWGLLALFGGILILGAAVIWSVVNGAERGLLRELSEGEKLIIKGNIAALDVVETNGTYFHCLRLNATAADKLPLNVMVPANVFRQLRRHEPVELACLPISKLVLAVSTNNIRWNIGDRSD